MKLHIAEWREAMGMSQFDLSLELGVSQAAVSHWEVGRNHPRLRTLEMIAGALGCDAADLFKKPNGGEKT